MRFEDERYVKVYTRDTANWMSLSYEAQCLFLQVLRKVDRAGILDLGQLGERAVAINLARADLWPRLRGPLQELIQIGMLEKHGTKLVVPRFIEAQDAIQSGYARLKKHREKARTSALRKSNDTAKKITGRREPETPRYQDETGRSQGDNSYTITYDPIRSNPPPPTPSAAPDARVLDITKKLEEEDFKRARALWDELMRLRLSEEFGDSLGPEDFDQHTDFPAWMRGQLGKGITEHEIGQAYVYFLEAKMDATTKPMRVFMRPKVFDQRILKVRKKAKARL